MAAFNFMSLVNHLGFSELKSFSLASISFCVVTLVAYYVVREFRRPPLPPGPKGRFPLLGMTFDLPKHHLVSILPVVECPDRNDRKLFV